MGLFEKLVKHLSPGANTQPGKNAAHSKNAAKERLKLALTYDRGGLPQGTIEQLRDEIIQVIVKHLAIQEEEIEINFDRTMEEDKLIASIPLRLAPRPARGKGSQTPPAADTPPSPSEPA